MASNEAIKVGHHHGVASSSTERLLEESPSPHSYVDAGD